MNRTTHVCSVLAVFLLMIGLPTLAYSQSEIVKALEFSNDGVLPSTDPDYYLFNNTAFFEDSLYEVDNGLLEQRTMDLAGNASYLLPDVFDGGLPNNQFEGIFDSSYRTRMEARIRVNEAQRADKYGIHFGYRDRSNYYLVDFDTEFVYAETKTGSKPAPILNSDFNIVRIESNANSPIFKLFVNDVEVMEAEATASDINSVGFADGRTPPENGGSADWDYVRFRALLVGDVNCDGGVDLLDVAPFVDLLTSGQFQEKADVNNDGTVDLLDVAPFVDLLVG